MRKKEDILNEIGSIIQHGVQKIEEASRTKKGKKVNKKYHKNLKDKGEYGSKEAMNKEIDKFAGTDNYKKDWKADHDSKGNRIKTKKKRCYQGL